MGWRSTAVALAALAAGCVADGAREGAGQGSDGDANSDTESDSAALVTACTAACVEATSAGECVAVPVPQQPNNHSLFCRWAELAATPAAVDGGLGDGGSDGAVGRCYCTADYYWDEDGVEEVEGCGEVAGQPAYAIDDGTTYVGLVSPPPLQWWGMSACAFNLEGEAYPAECGSLCDWPQDPAFECGTVDGVCTDANSGLMWTRLPVGCGPGFQSLYDLIASATVCDDVTSGGFEDWRLPTLDELRTLIRGCPQNGTWGTCPVGEGCADVACAAAACTECPLGQSPGSAENPCACCGAFDSGPCAWCEPWAGIAHEGCYLPVELAWPCGPYWSSTPATPVPEGGAAGYVWFVDFEIGAPQVTGELGSAYGNCWESGFAACVRSL